MQPDLALAFSDFTGELIPLDPSLSAFDGLPESAPQIPIDGENIAYVLYTSGSTGRPKGVAVPHRGLRNRLLWMQTQFHLGPDDAVLQKTPYSFDVSVWEFFWPLLAGARLVVAGPDDHNDPERLLALIGRQAVTTLHFVPSMLGAFLSAPGLQRAAGLR